jgi:heat shock protein HspQ
MVENNREPATARARFRIGQPVHHRLFDYRGVIFDVDPTFQASEDWYEAMARSRPPKDKPWYHLLVHNSDHTTYVAERNLEPDLSGAPIAHILIEHFFKDFEAGLYLPKTSSN